MTELERALETLEIVWPETPAFELRRPQRRRWPLAVAVAATLAIAAAFAVPQSRGAILRFFHVGGESIQRVHTLPPAAERSLRASLGTPIPPSRARQLLGRPFAVAGVPLYAAGAVVSAIVRDGLLLSEFRSDYPVVGKLAYAAGVRRIDARTVWITGRHVYLAPTLPARYAGNALVWERGALTYRLEGRTLTLRAAERLARTLR
jgi:hypothetical protein